MSLPETIPGTHPRWCTGCDTSAGRLPADPDSVGTLSHETDDLGGAVSLARTDNIRLDGDGRIEVVPGLVEVHIDAAGFTGLEQAAAIRDGLTAALTLAGPR